MKKILENKILNQFLILFGFLLILIQPMFTWFQADDYCLMQQLKGKSIFQAMIHDYLTWDGRFISISYIIGRLGLKLQLFWLNPLIATLLVILISWSFSKYQFKDNSRIFLNTFILVIIFWLGAYNFLSQTLYWSIGVVYIVELTLITLIYFCNKNNINIYLKSLIYLLSSTISPNALIAILMIEVITIIKFKKYKIINFLPILSILIGILVVSLSPGNKSRMPNQAEIINNLTNPIQIYINLKWMAQKVLEFNSPIVWLILVVGLISTSNEKNNKLFDYLNSYKWLLGAIVSILFFVPFPGFYIHSSRVNIHFFIFIFKYFLENFNYENFKYYLHNKLSLKYTIYIIFFSIITIETYDAKISKFRMNQREKLYKQNNSKDIVLKQSDLIFGPKTREFYDLNYNSDFWINQCVSNYFKLKSLSLEKAKEKESLY